MQAISNGDREAFRALYDNLSVKVYNTALSYSQNKQNAEEITQDVFTSIYKNASKFKGNSSVNTWVYRIAVNTSLNHIKSKKRFSFLSYGESKTEKSNFEHPGVLLENREDSKALFEAIRSLSEHQKTAFILSYIEDLPRQEVANVMETSLKAVESLLQRAKSNLRNKLGNLYPHRRKTKK